MHAKREHSTWFNRALAGSNWCIKCSYIMKKHKLNVDFLMSNAVFSEEMTEFEFSENRTQNDTRTSIKSNFFSRILWNSKLKIRQLRWKYLVNFKPNYGVEFEICSDFFKLAIFALHQNISSFFHHRNRQKNYLK